MAPVELENNTIQAFQNVARQILKTLKPVLNFAAENCIGLTEIGMKLKEIAPALPALIAGGLPALTGSAATAGLGLALTVATVIAFKAAKKIGEKKHGEDKNLVTQRSELASPVIKERNQLSEKISSNTPFSLERSRGAHQGNLKPFPQSCSRSLAFGNFHSTSTLGMQPA